MYVRLHLVREIETEDRAYYDMMCDNIARVVRALHHALAARVYRTHASLALSLRTIRRIIRRWIFFATDAVSLSLTLKAALSLSRYLVDCRAHALRQRAKTRYNKL